jgi:hypothetical protein
MHHAVWHTHLTWCAFAKLVHNIPNGSHASHCIDVRSLNCPTRCRVAVYTPLHHLCKAFHVSWPTHGRRDPETPESQSRGNVSTAGDTHCMHARVQRYVQQLCPNITCNTVTQLLERYQFGQNIDECAPSPVARLRFRKTRQLHLKRLAGFPETANRPAKCLTS